MLGVRCATLTIACLCAARIACAQPDTGQVLDQTGLALPGATVQLFDGPSLVSTVATDSQGRFSFDRKLTGDVIAVSLAGFETVRVSRGAIKRVVLALHASDTTTVVAPSMVPDSAATPLLGHALTATNVARMPSAHMKARESLPLLPSVVRGPDGLIQLGGAPAHETPLLLDGFNIADPATGISSLNLPLEAVRGVEALRDPMSVTYGGLVGGLVALDSKPGGDDLALGVQGFVPRPRFAAPGFGRLEGIFPRAYLSGGSGRLHFMIASEYDYERIPVPDVTTGQGPDLIEESSITFTRLDLDASDRHHITVEGLMFPGDTRSLGLSPLRDEAATTDLNQTDMFGGIIDRFVPDSQDVFTVHIGVLQHEMTLQPQGVGTSQLTPAGWTTNWFATASRVSRRYGATLSWERIARANSSPHDITMTAEFGARSLSGRLFEAPVSVRGLNGRVVRSVDFEGASQVSASDRPLALAVQDAWQITERLQVDGGARIDHSRYGGAAPSARASVRYAVDRSGATVIKAGIGSFVGSLPLAAPAFAGQAARVDRAYDAQSGALLHAYTWVPAARLLQSPMAFAGTVAVERQIVPGLDAQASVSARQSSRLATLDVPAASGPLTVSSTGAGWYREAQLSVRRTWLHDQQLFVSYVRSSSHGELNDFQTLFESIDAPLLQPGGQSLLPGDAPHRLLAWATIDLPAKVVVSPVTEWRSGFPYSVVDERYAYLGAPNSRRYPTFFSTDMVVYKTFTVHHRSADVGVQLFNVTNHRNPRDVYPVSGSPQFGAFTNSVGTIVRGYMLLKW